MRIAPADLVGHWRAAHGSLTIDWVFSGDGTFSGQITQGSRIASDFTGTWRLEGNSLLTVYERDLCGVIESGVRDRDIFLEFASDQFLIRTTCTGERRYTRIK